MGARKLSAGDLARFLHVSRDTAARRMKGEGDINLDELEAIAGWLDVPVTRLIAPAPDAAFSA
jgi:transcriptional regulator with XRE-family HTH domain